MRQSLYRLFFLGFLTLLFSSPSSAVPIVYTFYGQASGTIGGTSFVNSPYRISVSGDTDGIILNGGIESDGYANQGVMTVSVSGVATATVPGETLVACDQVPFLYCYFFWGSAGTIVSVLQAPPQMASLDQSLNINGLKLWALFLTQQSIPSDRGPILLTSTSPVVNYSVSIGGGVGVESVPVPTLEKLSLLFIVFSVVFIGFREVMKFRSTIESPYVH